MELTREQKDLVEFHVAATQLTEAEKTSYLNSGIFVFRDSVYEYRTDANHYIQVKQVRESESEWTYIDNSEALAFYLCIS